MAAAENQNAPSLMPTCDGAAPTSAWATRWAPLQVEASVIGDQCDRLPMRPPAPVGSYTHVRPSVAR